MSPNQRQAFFAGRLIICTCFALQSCAASWASSGTCHVSKSSGSLQAKICGGAFCAWLRRLPQLSRWTRRFLNVQAGEFEKPNLIGHEVGVGGLTEDSFESTLPIGLGDSLRVALQIECREQEVAP